MKKWTYAFDLGILSELRRLFPDISVSDEVEDAVRTRRYEIESLRRLKEESKANSPIDFSVEGVGKNGVNPLYNYQRHGVRCAIYSDGGFLIGDSCGLGKTLQGIGIFLLMKNKKKYRNCLVVCPASVKYNWLNEISKFTDEKAVVIDGNVEQRFQQWLAPDVFFKIVNYELLTRDLFFFDTYDKDGNPRDFRIPGYQQVIDGFFDMCICDEVHYLGGHKNQRTQAMKAMKFKYRLGLTGTPIDGSLTTFHSIMEWVKPGLFPHIGKFLDRYAVFGHFGEVKRFVHVDEFKEKIAPYYIRRLAKDVLTDLPPVTHQNLYVELSDSSMSTYRKLAKRKHPVTKDEEQLVTIIRCRQFCDDPDIIGLKDRKDKLDALEALLDEVIGSGNKVIVFTQYTDALVRIRERLSGKFGICELDTCKTRFDSCEAFNNDDRYSIMLMTDAGSVGINLQSASYVVNFDQNWSPAVMIQRYCRAWRNGQKKPVIVVNMICKDTVEERVMEAIAQKSKFSSEVLDEDIDEMNLGSSLSLNEIFNML